MTRSTAALADSPNCNGGSNGSQSIVVHLKKNTEGLQAAIMPARMGCMLAEGRNVTLFLTLRGVRLADASVPQNLTFGRDDLSPSPSLQQAVASFQANLGTVAVCPACGAEVGLTPADLIPGDVILESQIGDL
jgi:hypothetical protein